MRNTQAEKILALLEKITSEADLLGKMIYRKGMQPVPVRVRAADKLKFK